jgi:hypothetical protein
VLDDTDFEETNSVEPTSGSKAEDEEDLKETGFDSLDIGKMRWKDTNSDSADSEDTDLDSMESDRTASETLQEEEIPEGRSC